MLQIGYMSSPNHRLLHRGDSQDLICGCCRRATDKSESGVKRNALHNASSSLSVFSGQQCRCNSGAPLRMSRCEIYRSILTFGYPQADHMRIPTHVKLPRHWCTHPIARSSKLRIQWHKGQDGLTRYWCNVPGADARALWLNKSQIPLRTHANWTNAQPEPRLPTGICTSTLATVLAIAQKHRTSSVEFPSLYSMLRACTAAPDCGNRGPHNFYTNGMWHAIRLWQVLAVEWSRAYLPPPFSAVELGPPIRNGQRAITVHLSSQWLRACEKGVGLKLPLPMQAFSHNIILATLASGSDRVDINEFGYRVSGNKLFTQSTPLVPNPTWAIVKKWYEAHGGMIDYRPDPPTIVPQTKRLTPGKRMTITVIKP